MKTHLPRSTNHLGGLLTRSTPRPKADLNASISQIAKWKAENFELKFTAEPTARGTAHHPNELQEGIAKAKERLAALEAQQIIALQTHGKESESF